MRKTFYVRFVLSLSEEILQKSYYPHQDQLQWQGKGLRNSHVVGDLPLLMVSAQLRSYFLADIFEFRFDANSTLSQLDKRILKYRLLELV